MGIFQLRPIITFIKFLTDLDFSLVLFLAWKPDIIHMVDFQRIHGFKTMQHHVIALSIFDMPPKLRAEADDLDAISIKSQKVFGV